MERTTKIHIEKLPEGVYLATSNDVQDLMARGRTVLETIEFSRDAAGRLIESQSNLNLPEVEEQFDSPLIIG